MKAGQDRSTGEITRPYPRTLLDYPSSENPYTNDTGAVILIQAPIPSAAELVQSRLKDFFAHRTPWHRRLWNISTSRRYQVAADRLAALVTCSLPRAELTTLAYKHMENSDDSQLTRLLDSAATKYEKAQLVEQHLRSGGQLTLGFWSDFAAEDRLIAIVTDPAKELERIRRYITQALRRLYNQRNTIAHSGSFRSAVLQATTRTALSLVGAGLDRIVYAQLETGGHLSPLGLVARAEVELRLVGKPGGRDLCSLLR